MLRDGEADENTSIFPFEKNTVKASDRFRDTTMFEKCSRSHCTGLCGNKQEVIQSRVSG